MLRNYIATALRNLVRNKLYAVISAGGLAIAFATALLIVLFARDEFSYDTWIPEHERIVQITSNAKFPHFTDTLAMAPGALGQMLRDEIAGVEATVRITGTETTVGAGEIEGLEVVLWPDVNFFDVFDLPLVAGERATALRDAETVVITRRIALKYFGSADVVGRTLTLGRTTPLKITGVMEDLPSNTHLDLGILISAASAGSPFAAQDAKPMPGAGLPWVVYLYAKLRGGDLVDDVRSALPNLVLRHPEFSARVPSFTFDAHALADIHFGSVRVFAMKPPANPDVVYGFLLTGFFVVALAVVNYAGVTSATVVKRATEIGVRKLSGAARAHLYWQFLSENLLSVGIAMVAALMMAWAALPALNGFLQRTIAFPTHAGWFGGVASTVLAVSLLAGGYPALILARLRPARILKSERMHGRSRLRGVLISFQFAVLIGLGLVAGVVYAQLRYVLTEGLRFNKDLVLQVNAPCGTAFDQEVRKLAGVRATVCGNTPILRNGAPVPATASDGRELSVGAAAVDFGYLEFFGLSPRAGRFFSPAFGGDIAPVDRAAPSHPTVVINESLMRALGFSAPDEAVGQSLRWGRLLAPNAFKLTEQRPSEIIGVVPDFARGSLRDAIPPTVFWVDPALHRIINIKLDGARVPETLAAIDGLWRSTGAARAISRSFVDQAVDDLYRDLAQQTQVLGYLTAVAMVIAAFGLFGLAAFTAEQRTKEIGIRKSMGATRIDILRLILWQFAKPVLWANVIAWPAAYFIMRRWLDGFAYRIVLAPWMFLAASGLALAIALATVIGHALLVARARPVAALRYE